MRILMVYPEVPKTYWGGQYALEFVSKKAGMPPLGLLTVAAMLPPGFLVKLVDMNVEPLVDEHIEWADMVFLSAMIIQKRSFQQVVERCKSLGKTVVAGGPYPISSFEQIRGVDHFVLDEAELTLPVFLQDLENGTLKKVYRDSDKPDITLTPIPRFDLIDVSLYNCMPLQFSRGCPYQCEFCDIIVMFGRKQRTKLPDQFVQELEAVYRTGFRGSVFIVDDNFVGNRRKVKALLRRIVGWQKTAGYPFAFNTEASIDLAEDDELLGLMVEAGFVSVFIGVETPDEAALLAVKKRQNLKTDLLAGIEKIQRKGIEVSGGFIIGFDTDTPKIFDRQISFIQEAAIPLAMVGLLVAAPNTALYNRLEKEGRLTADPTGNNTHDLTLNFQTRMPRDILLSGYKRVLSEIYSPRLYFQRCLRLLGRLPRRANRSQSIRREHIRALFRSLFRQTFSSYGRHYLAYVAKSLFINMAQFSTGVTLAVEGHHFFLITREILRADEFVHLLAEIKTRVRAQCYKVVNEQKPQRVREALNAVSRAKSFILKEYRMLSRGVQHYLRDAVADFEGFCERLMEELAQVPSTA